MQKAACVSLRGKITLLFWVCPQADCGGGQIVVLRVVCGGGRGCGRGECRSLLIWVSRGQYGLEREGGKERERERNRESESDYRDVDKMSFRCIPCFTAHPRRQRLILCSPLCYNGVAGWTLKAKLPINEPIICVIMWRLQLVLLMHCFSHVNAEDWKES